MARSSAVEKAIDAEYGPGAGAKVVAAAEAMHQALDGGDAAGQSSANTRAHWRFLATVALEAAGVISKARAA